MKLEAWRTGPNLTQTWYLESEHRVSAVSCCPASPSPNWAMSRFCGYFVLFLTDISHPPSLRLPLNRRAQKKLCDPQHCELSFTRGRPTSLLHVFSVIVIRGRTENGPRLTRRSLNSQLWPCSPVIRTQHTKHTRRMTLWSS